MSRRQIESNDRGAAAVEFAIVAPVLALLLVIALDYARVFYDTVTLWNCRSKGPLYEQLEPHNGIPLCDVTAAAQADSGNCPRNPRSRPRPGRYPG